MDRHRPPAQVLALPGHLRAFVALLCAFDPEDAVLHATYALLHHYAQLRGLPVPHLIPLRLPRAPAANDLDVLPWL